MKNKILIAVSSLIILLSIIAIIFIIKDSKKEPEEFKIDSLDVLDDKELLKDTKYDTLDITNQVLSTRNNISTYNAILENNTESDYKIDSLYVVFTTDKEEIESLALSDTLVKANQSVVINISFDKDISKTTKIAFKNSKNEEVNN